MKSKHSRKNRPVSKSLPRLLFCTASALGVLGLGSSPVRAGQFKFGEHTITVPDGFDVELVADSPLVQRPIAADFDWQGRLYVADSSGSNEAPQKQLEHPNHRIVRLTDSKGDGVFDQATVFADKVMFPEGAMFLDGSFYVGAPPSIWKFTDTDGDGVADKREEWMKPGTLTGCANDLHGPYAGPDGWIYWSKGAFAKQTYERPGHAAFSTRAAHIFRTRHDGTGIEPVMTGGMDNPVGVIFTETGERIFTTTFLQNPGGGKRDGLIHAVYGGVYGKVNDVTDEHPHTGDLLPPLTHLGAAAPCGLIRYDAEIFGRDYRNNLFSCCFNLHKVMRHVVQPKGATYQTIDSDFVTSDDPDFHPTGVLEDADGSLLVLNTGGWYKLCCPTSQLAKPDVLGAIYRVRRHGGPKLEDARGQRLDWAKLEVGALMKLLDDPRTVVRQRAIASLAGQGDKAVAGLRTVVKESRSLEARRNALWCLTRIPSPEAREVVRLALGDADSSVRHVAVHSISLLRDALAFDALVSRLQDADVQVRRSAAEALGRLRNPAAIQPLFAAIDEASPEDRMLEHSLIFALIEINDAKATRAGLAVREPKVARAALIALDQMASHSLDSASVVPYLNSSVASLRDAGNWIALHHSDWGGALAENLKERLSSAELAADRISVLETQLAQFSGDSAIQTLLLQTVSDPKSSQWARQTSLHAMGRANLKPAPATWIREVAILLSGSDLELMRSALTTARTLALPKGGDAGLEAALRQLGADATKPAAIRLQALSVTGPLTDPAPDLFEFLVGNVDPGKDWSSRNDAASALGRAKLGQVQLLSLAEVLTAVGPMELTKLLGAFERNPSEATGHALVTKLKTAKAFASLRVDSLKTLLSKYPVSVQQEATEIYHRLAADAASQSRQLDQMLTELPKGDIRRGQNVFNSPKVACVSCHSIGYLGGQVGPDLTSIGGIRTEKDLLESIVFPSASFVRSYEPVLVRTQSGDEYNGIIKKDAADEVVLVTGPQAEQRIARADVAEMRPGTISLMPQGLSDQLSRQELSDLVTFLKNTKWGAQ